jgi:hypothetical protein
MSDVHGEAFTLGPGEGRSIDLGNFAMSVKATGDATAGAFSLLEAAEPAGFGPPDAYPPQRRRGLLRPRR